MTTDPVQVISFDYGNTLIEFGPDQVSYMNGALLSELTKRFGACDTDRLKALRDTQIMRPFSNDFIENNIEDTTRELIETLYGITAAPSQIDALMQVRYESFVHVINTENGLKGFLETLKPDYHLALISNYPCTRSIRSSLDKIGITDLFDVIVVSGEIGYVKPHNLPFQAVLSHFNVTPDRCLHVGDNWLADIQGAKRQGMKAVLTTEYEPYDHFEPAKGDHPPDHTIQTLSELTTLL